MSEQVLTASPLVTVVVPVRDDPRVDELLRSLTHQDQAPPFEVIVALDGSSRTPRLPPGLPARLLRLDAAGPYAARNAAIRQARGPIVAMTDSDCICPPDWLASLAAEFREPTLLALQGGSRARSTSRLSAWVQREYERYVASHAGRGYRRFCNTRNFAIRTELARAYPFPERFIRGGDTMYGRLLEQAGAAIRYEPDWYIHHRHSRSRLAEGRKAFYEGRDGARWERLTGVNLFGPPPESTRGPGSWVLRHLPTRNPWRRAASVALLGLAVVLALASFIIPGEIGYRFFGRFRRASHLAGRLRGESAASSEAED
jgi:glycosyltransferase involved in cell wall biosynthesis